MQEDVHMDSGLVLEGEVELLQAHTMHCAAGVSWRPAGANLAWQEAALRSLDHDLQKLYGAGAGIVFRHGPYLEALLDVARAASAGAVFFSRRCLNFNRKLYTYCKRCQMRNLAQYCRHVALTSAGYMTTIAGLLQGLTAYLIYPCRYEPAMRATDERVAAGLREAGLLTEAFNTYLLYEPEDVKISMGGRWTGHFGTLMPFLRCVTCRGHTYGRLWGT